MKSSQPNFVRRWYAKRNFRHKSIDLYMLVLLYADLNNDMYRTKIQLTVLKFCVSKYVYTLLLSVGKCKGKK